MEYILSVPRNIVMDMNNVMNMCWFGTILQNGDIKSPFLGIIGQDPSVSKSNRLHVAIFQFCFIKLGVYSIDSYV